MDIVIHEPWNGIELTDEQADKIYNNGIDRITTIRRFVDKEPDHACFEVGDYVYGDHTIRRPGIVVKILCEESWHPFAVNRKKPIYETKYLVRWLDRKGQEKIEVCKYLTSFIEAVDRVKKQLNEHRKNLKELEALSVEIAEEEHLNASTNQ